MYEVFLERAAERDLNAVGGTIVTLRAWLSVVGRAIIGEAPRGQGRPYTFGAVREDNHRY